MEELIELQRKYDTTPPEFKALQEAARAQIENQQKYRPPEDDALPMSPEEFAEVIAAMKELEKYDRTPQFPSFLTFNNKQGVGKS